MRAGRVIMHHPCDAESSRRQDAHSIRFPAFLFSLVAMGGEASCRGVARMARPVARLVCWAAVGLT